MNAMILCGGLSSRLGDITKSIPKILLEIGGKTVLDWQLEKLKAIGIDTVVLAAGHLSEVLMQTVGETRLGMNLVYAVERERLGTGGAIKFGYTFFEDKDAPTIILNGDVLFTASLGEMVSQLRPESDGSLLGVYVDDVSSYGVLEISADGHVDSFREKEGKHVGGYINGSVYLFNSRAQSYFPDTDVFSIEYDVFPRMTSLYAYTSDAPWIDIGVPERLAWAKANAETFFDV